MDKSISITIDGLVYTFYDRRALIGLLDERADEVKEADRVTGID